MENSPTSYNGGENAKPGSEFGDDDKDAKKSKSKAKKSDGLMGTSAEKTADKQKDDADKKFDLGSFMLGKTEAADSKADIESVDSGAGEIESDLEADNSAPEISDFESLEAVQQMAAERRDELNAEVAENSEASDDSARETEMAIAYYDQILQHDAMPEAAAETVIADIPSSPSAKSPTPNAAPTPINLTPNSVPVTPNTPPTPPILANPLNPYRPNRAPSTSPNVVPVAAPNLVNSPDRSQAFGDMLIGGVIGYLIGKRRGRIKTERKLIPVQRKLEAEVGVLKQKVIDGEFAVRAAARRSVEVAQPNVIERTITPNESQVRGPKVAPERIGKVIVLGESVRAVVSEKTAEVIVDRTRVKSAETVESQIKETASKPGSLSIEKQVEVMNRYELLSLSEKIRVEGSTLRQVYETHLISERGLRRLVAEHLRGGNVLRMFKREVIEREIDFERDPKLREEIRSRLASGGVGGDSDAKTKADSPLQQLLAKAGISDSDTNQSASNNASKQSKKSKPAFTPVDMTIGAVIAILVAVISVILLSK